MLLFSYAKPELTFRQLSERMQDLPIVAKWAEDEWGYIRNKGIEFRENLMRDISERVFVGYYADSPIAMFALFEEDNHLGSNRCELMYVYVKDGCRGLGFGKQIIDQAKKLAAELFNSNLIKLDTLKPRLNKFYAKQGAEFIGEGNLFSHPADVLGIKI